MDTITSLLRKAQEGSVNARDQLYAHVYVDLKIVARKHLRNCKAGVLQTTALVNAAYERLAAREVFAASDRRQFFYFLSRAMHDVLVDQVRADLAQKRGGGKHRIPLIELAADETKQRIDILDLHEALSELGGVDSEAELIRRQHESLCSAFTAA
jgi:RNA polymerase sigma factor (TIGR02999 family)